MSTHVFGQLNSVKAERKGFATGQKLVQVDAGEGGLHGCRAGGSDGR